MKILSIFKLYFFIAVVALLESCQKERLPDNSDLSESLTTASKENKLLPFKGTFTTNYSFVPDIAGGWTAPNPAPAWYPGGGDGNLTHVGTCQTNFNQYATFGPAGLQSAGAPVNMFFATSLAPSGYVVPNTVTTIFYTSNGQSVWSMAVGMSATVPVSATRVEFTANHEIIGGTGRFHDAKGTYILKGFFNPQDPEDAGFEVNGWIEY